MSDTTVSRSHARTVHQYHSEGASLPLRETGADYPMPVSVYGNQVGAFGELLTTEPTPIIQIANQYQLDPALRSDLETFTATGGSADSSGNLFRCQTGTSVGGYGVIRSKESLIYRAGEGVEATLTAAFTTGIPLSIQFAGAFSLTETLAFGYDGADFSAIYSHNGVAEVQTITVTGAAGGAESATVTLDGDAFTASLTNTTVQGNAFEIARDGAADATVGAKWRFEQINDKVVAIARAVGDKTGTMSFSSSTATATLAETAAGAAKDDDHVAQANWSVTSTPFADFDPTKLNIYRIQYGYLGISNINFSVYNPNTGRFVLVHRVALASTQATTSMGSPDMKVGWTSASLGSSGTNLTVLGASGRAAVQGKEVANDGSYAADNTAASVSTTLTNILTVKNRIVYGSRFNLGKILPASASLDNDHNKGAIVEVRVNATLGGVPNYQFEDESNSLGIVDKAATTVTGGTLIDAFTVPAGGDATVDLAALGDVINPEDTLTIAAKTISGTSTAMTAAVIWKEEK